MSDPLSPSSLITQSQSLCSPSTLLSSPSSVLSLLLHSLHSSLSFRLISPTPQEDNKLPSEWPSSQRGDLNLKYKHDQSSLQFVISVVDLGDKLMVVGNAVDNPRSTSFEFLTIDYFSPSTSYPIPVSSLSTSNPFSTESRLKDLILLYRLNILQKLIPGLRKDGYTELDSSQTPSSSTSSGEGSGRRLPPLGGTGDYLPDSGGPLGMFPPQGGGGGRVPQPRGDDPLRIPGSGGRGGGARPIGEIGRNDLEPLGGMGGTFGGMGRLPGGGPGGIGGGDGGGMFMGPDHPLFRERFEGGNGGSPLPHRDDRRWGGDGYLPPGGAPPGARFDPVGPENGPPGSSGGAFGLPQGTFGPGRGGGRGGGGIGGGRGGGGLGGRQVHPDIEQPGRGGSDYDAMFG